MTLATMPRAYAAGYFACSPTNAPARPLSDAVLRALARRDEENTP